MAIDLGTIEKVDLREVWTHEAADFTPWLAENISLLGEALGLELEIEEQEASVGTYSLDILARDLGTNRPVVIENQLEPTNHTHLGQLLTYSAGFDANVIVWIAKEFGDQHRAALDWLNHRTGNDTEFFAVELELWRIDDSRQAPNFNVAASPNDWSKQNAGRPRSAAGGQSIRGEKYRTFFQELIDCLRNEHNFTTARKAQPASWWNSASNKSAIRYGASFARDKSARVELYLDRNREFNKDLFDTLKESQETLEEGLGCQLSWERLDENKASRIAVYTDGSIDDDDQMLEEIRAWMVERLLKFEEVFGPRLAELVE